MSDDVTTGEVTATSSVCCARAPHAWNHPAPEPEREVAYRFVGRGRAESRKHLKAKVPTLFRERPRGVFKLTPHERRVREAQKARAAGRKK